MRINVFFLNSTAWCHTWQKIGLPRNTFHTSFSSFSSFLPADWITERHTAQKPHPTSTQPQPEQDPPDSESRPLSTWLWLGAGLLGTQVGQAQRPRIAHDGATKWHLVMTVVNRRWRNVAITRMLLPENHARRCLNTELLTGRDALSCDSSVVDVASMLSARHVARCTRSGR